MLNSNIIFVYGTLRRGCINNDILKDCPFLGKARTRDCYSLYMLNSGLPAVIKIPKIQVAGELYEVSDDMLIFLDRFEGHPNLYIREEIVVIDEQDKDRNAYIYFYNSSLLDIKHEQPWVVLGLSNCWAY